MAETLRQRIEALRDDHATEAANRRYVLLADIHANEAATLTTALALPDGPEPRDLALRAFADAMTPEMWQAVKHRQPPQGRAWSDLEVMMWALNTLRAALTKEG